MLAAGNRDRWLVPVAIFAASVLVKALGALLISQPGYMDAYYYYHVAANLAAGRGFVEDVLWNYLDNPAGLPHPSNLYWLPLTSALIAPALVVFGASFRSAQVSVILLSSFLPVISYFTALRFGLSRFRAIAVASLTIFSGVYFIYWAVPDVLACFGVAGALALYCTARGMEAGRRWFLAAAACAGLAHLARPDGVLLLGVLLVMVLASLWWPAARETGTGSGARGSLATGGVLLRGLGWAASVVLVYLLVLAPWLYRNWQAIGAVWPSSLEVLFQREYNDIFRYGRTLDLAYYLDWGWQNILGSKIHAAGENLLVFAEPFTFYLLPFGLIGFWQLRRDRRAWPYLLYCVTLYLAMTLLFTFAGPRGSYLHSMAALLPFFFVASVNGIATAVHWVAGRLRHWVEPRAQRNFLLIAVGIAAVMSGVLSVRSALTWDDRYHAYEELAAWFAANAPSHTRVMVVDPPGWFYSSGKSAIVVASEDLDTNLVVCRRYGASYLLLEAAHPLALHDLYLGKQDSPSLALRDTVAGVRIYQVLPAEAR